MQVRGVNVVGSTRRRLGFYHIFYRTGRHGLSSGRPSRHTSLASPLRRRGVDGKLVDVGRRAVTVEVEVEVEVDEKLLDAARAVAERTGVPADELYERALRDVLARDFGDLMGSIARDQATRGVSISEEDGLALAYDELRAARGGRRNAS
jgi:hypothetical protein